MNVKELTGENPNVWKYVFSDDTTVVEAVLYKYPDFNTRTVICCSTQSGCPVGCRFCGTGEYFIRNLTADEIVNQPRTLLEKHNIDPTQVDRMQIMFMSMGEPLMNWTQTEAAIRKLHEMYPRARLLISTSAPKLQSAWDGVFQVSQDVPTVGLQFSVHDSTDERRDALIPYKNKLNLIEIADMGVAWFKATGRKPFFNYCAQEHNTSVMDADRLWHLFDPQIFECTISVVCERGESIAKANDRQKGLAEGFMEKMLERGFSVRKFDPAGQDDIGGGCGQLHQVQKWIREHPQLAKPSAGFGKEEVHMPVCNEEACVPA
jgi:23S rRNA (adenine2503-C2)-methyltransferase